MGVLRPDAKSWEPNPPLESLLGIDFRNLINIDSGSSGVFPLIQTVCSHSTFLLPVWLYSNFRAWAHFNSLDRKSLSSRNDPTLLATWKVRPHNDSDHCLPSNQMNQYLDLPAPALIHQPTSEPLTLHLDCGLALLPLRTSHRLCRHIHSPSTDLWLWGLQLIRRRYCCRCLLTLMFLFVFRSQFCINLSFEIREHALVLFRQLIEKMLKTFLREPTATPTTQLCRRSIFSLGPNPRLNIVTWLSQVIQHVCVVINVRHDGDNLAVKHSLSTHRYAR